MQIKVDSAPLEVESVQEDYSTLFDGEIKHSLQIIINNTEKELKYFKDLFEKASTIDVPNSEGTEDRFTLDTQSSPDVRHFSKTYQSNKVAVLCSLGLVDAE